MSKAKLALFKKKKHFFKSPVHHGLIPSFCTAAAWEEPSCHHQYSPHTGNDAIGYRSAICLFQWQRYSVAESIASVLMDLHLLTPRLITVPSSQHLPQCWEKIQVEESCMQSGCLRGITAATGGLTGDIWGSGAVLLVLYGPLHIISIVAMKHVHDLHFFSA